MRYGLSISKGDLMEHRRCARRLGAAAALATAAVVVTTAIPETPPRVALAATITPGSATNWQADGIDSFYGIPWNDTYGPTEVSPFHLVDFWNSWANIVDDLDAAQGDGFPDVVVSSGRGAGNASAVLTYLAAKNAADPRLVDTFWILDNNVDRPNGGYATRYPSWALVGVNPVPAANTTDAAILDVGYEYVWNSSAPAYISNLPALLNSIIAYAYRYAQQDQVSIPDVILDGEGRLVPGASGHYVVHTDGSWTRYDTAPGVTTVYVTYETEHLPMLQPLRDLGGKLGNTIADVIEPVLRVLVNAAYPNNDPIGNPETYTPMRLFAPLSVTLRALCQLPEAIEQGLASLTPDPEPSVEQVERTPATPMAVTRHDAERALTPEPAATEDVTPAETAEPTDTTQQPSSAEEASAETGSADRKTSRNDGDPAADGDDGAPAADGDDGTAAADDNDGDPTADDADDSDTSAVANPATESPSTERPTESPGVSPDPAPSRAAAQASSPAPQ